MRFSLALCGLSVVCGVAAAEPAAQPAATPPAAAPAATPPAAAPAATESAAAPAATESVHEALCRMIETASRQHGVAADFLVNLIWRESSFRDRAVSPAGAQGIAQFMPGTAARRGLNDPFDPEKAIPEAARLIADLAARFGNLGLAAAAYNAGPGRDADLRDARHRALGRRLGRAGRQRGERAAERAGALVHHDRRRAAPGAP